MAENNIAGSASLKGRKFELTESTLILKKIVQGQSTSYELFLEATEGKEDGCIIRLDYMPVERVSKFEDLLSARIHFEDTSSCEPDDTLGSDPNELIETSGWFVSPEDEDIWHFESMTATFEHLGNHKFLIKILCSVSNCITDKIVRGQAEFRAEATVEEDVLPERKPKNPEQVIDSVLNLYKKFEMHRESADRIEIVDTLHREAVSEIKNKAKLNSQQFSVAEKLLNELQILLRGGPQGYVKLPDCVRLYAISDILYNEIVGTIPHSMQLSFIGAFSNLMREALINFSWTAEELEKAKMQLRQEMFS